MRAPMVLHIQDLVPDVAIAAGMLDERSLPVRAARRLERFVYRHADAHQRHLRRISDESRRETRSVREDSHPAELDHLASMTGGDGGDAFRTAHGVQPNDFLVMYSGGVGFKQGLETVIETADAMRAEERLKFMLIGEGPPLSDLKALATARNVPTSRSCLFKPRAGLLGQLSAADALLITQRKTVRDVVFPGKLLYYMAAGRAIVAAVDAESETGRFVAANRVASSRRRKTPSPWRGRSDRSTARAPADWAGTGARLSSASSTGEWSYPRLRSCSRRSAGIAR